MILYKIVLELSIHFVVSSIRGTTFVYTFTISSIAFDWDVLRLWFFILHTSLIFHNILDTHFMLFWCLDNAVEAPKVLKHVAKELQKATIHRFYSVNIKQGPCVFGCVFQLQVPVENFLDIISKWYGYGKCSLDTGIHVE